MSNRFLKLPLPLDVNRLRNDLVRCQRLVWTGHYNQADFAGNWASLSLRSASGSATDILAHDQNQGYRDTPALEQCPYFAELLRRLPVKLQAVRLLALGPGSLIREHTDHQLGYEYGCFRLHVPLQTGSAVQFRVDGADLPMRVGECWYANFHRPHSVRNDGSTDRIHLVIDGLRNDWSDEWFRRAGYDFAYEARMRDYSPDTKRKMIDELERQDTDAARQLTARLRREIEQTPVLRHD